MTRAFAQPRREVRVSPSAPCPFGAVLDAGRAGSLPGGLALPGLSPEVLT